MAIEISLRQSNSRKKRSPKQKAIINAMETRMVLESDRLLARLSYINLIAVLAPLLGLLGTVMGIIETLTNRNMARCHPAPFELHLGFHKALISTLIGLAVAIPAKVIYRFLHDRTVNFILEVNLLARDLMSRFTDPE